jgi:hypothetical protein
MRGRFISRLRESGLKADLLALAQRRPDVTHPLSHRVGEYRRPPHQELSSVVESAGRVQHQEANSLTSHSDGG